MHEAGLWFYLVVGLIALGFDIGVIVHAPKVTQLVYSARLTFFGKTLGRIFLLYLTWNATKAPNVSLGWQYWLVTGAGLFAIAGMFSGWYEFNKYGYGRRRTDNRHNRRRDDQ